MRFIFAIILILTVGVCGGEEKTETSKAKKKLSALGTVTFSSGSKYPRARVIFDKEEISLIVAGEEKAQAVKVKDLTTFKQSVAEEKYEAIKVGKKTTKKPIRSFAVEITTADKKIITGRLSSPLTITIITGAAALTGTMKKIASGKAFDYWEIEHQPLHSGDEISHKDMDILRQKIRTASSARRNCWRASSTTSWGAFSVKRSVR